MKLNLSIATDVNPRTRPIIDGSVEVDGVRLIHTPLDPSEMFWRQLKFGDFDISEMSFSSLIKAVARGDDTWVGIPNSFEQGLTPRQVGLNEVFAENTLDQ